MARVHCKCGETLTNTETNDIQLRVYTDREWEEKVNIGLVDSINIPFPKYDVWHCPSCERVYVFNWGEDKAIKVYTLEHL